MTNRLLHAAARGARIERRLAITKHVRTEWTEPQVLPVAFMWFDDGYDYRIHPDDEALQYGPISTALRSDAVAPPWDFFGIDYHAQAFVSDELFHSGNSLIEIEFADYLHRSLFLLILSEFFADIGL
jgi:hypothetical protein